MFYTDLKLFSLTSGNDCACNPKETNPYKYMFENVLTFVSPSAFSKKNYNLENTLDFKIKFCMYIFYVTFYQNV